MLTDFTRNAEIVSNIKQIIYKHSGEISVAEAIGLIEIAKLDLLEEQRSTLNDQKG